MTDPTRYCDAYDALDELLNPLTLDQRNLAVHVLLGRLTVLAPDAVIEAVKATRRPQGDAA